MLGPEAQEALLARLVEAAKRRGLMVAPVGSVFFLRRGRPTTMTKDLDAVVLDSSWEPAALEEVEALGRDLGEVETGMDRASVTVTVPGFAEGPVAIDLVRGKEGSKRGFFPRSLLREAARRGTTEEGIVWFPVEYVIVLKADAAVDRGHRSASASFGDRNRIRAQAFRDDVVTQVQAALERGQLRPDYLKDAVGHLKAARREEVARLLEFAAAGRLSLE